MGEGIEMKSYKKSNETKIISLRKTESAENAIGDLSKNMDLFILTFGQFSLIDALVAILGKTGPAHVVISTWTAADAHLERSKALMESAQVLSFRMIVDRSFETRQPGYAYHMRELFGKSCIRAIRTHAKFLIIRNDKWDIVVRTSMNLNENPRLENIEISENKEFAEFFQTIADEIFREVKEGENKSDMLELESIPEKSIYKKVTAKTIKRESLNEPKTTHIIKK